MVRGDDNARIGNQLQGLGAEAVSDRHDRAGKPGRHRVLITALGNQPLRADLALLGKLGRIRTRRDRAQRFSGGQRPDRGGLPPLGAGCDHQDEHRVDPTIPAQP